jgi:hypothetical protein
VGLAVTATVGSFLCNGTRLRTRSTDHIHLRFLNFFGGFVFKNLTDGGSFWEEGQTIQKYVQT